jgi:hypothetical protein
VCCTPHDSDGHSATRGDRDLEVIRRIQKGAFAHPEHDAYPNQIDVFCAEQVSNLHRLTPFP